MNLYVVYLAKPKYGGWASFTSHLYRGMVHAGYEPKLLKAGNRTEKHLRSFGRGIKYQNVSHADLIKVAEKNHILITALDKNYHDIGLELLQRNATIVIHDPTELKPQVAETLQTSKVVIIRELQHLLPNATYIKHPYQRRTPKKQINKRQAVAISRIDFDKYTNLIVEANLKLEQPIDIYGFNNSMYAHFKLEPIDPDWKRNYKGTFDSDDLWSATKIAAQYHHVVDMSAIKGDGGGTQYTFLEAIDAGSNLILNTEWKPTGLLSEYCDTVTTSEELIEVCKQTPHDKTAIAEALLAEHDARHIAHQYYHTITT